MTTRNPSARRGRARKRLVHIPLPLLHSHPKNVNRMSDAFLDKLAANIAREGDYPPLVVRPHPHLPGHYELLDGHQRAPVLGRLGFSHAWCYVWPCDDATALVLLATLNRLEGQDDPRLHAELLRELAVMLPADELTLLLPDDAGALSKALAGLDLDVDAVLADLEHGAGDDDGLREIAFTVNAEDAAAIEEVVRAASATLVGRNRRGRALALIARTYVAV